MGGIKTYPRKNDEAFMEKQSKWNSSDKKKGKGKENDKKDNCLMHGSGLSYDGDSVSFCCWSIQRL